MVASFLFLFRSVTLNLTHVGSLQLDRFFKVSSNNLLLCLNPLHAQQWLFVCTLGCLYSFISPSLTLVVSRHIQDSILTALFPLLSFVFSLIFLEVSMETSRSMCMPNSLLSVVYENFAFNSSPSSCLLYADVTHSSYRGSPPTGCYMSYALCHCIWRLIEEFNQRSLGTVFIVDDLVILYVLFSCV